MQTFSKIFRRSFLEGFTASGINSYYVTSALAATFLISFYIFLIYRVITRKTFYSKNFGISLVCTALITTGIILTIQTSIVVSLGMVGALSIVRFRTAIKDPLDLVFLFWSISVGIICGAGYAQYAIILSLFITVAIEMLNYLPVAKAPMILIVNADSPSAEIDILEKIKPFAKFATVKSRNLTASSLDLTIEVRTAQGADLVQSVLTAQGVTSAALMAHDGEVTF